MHGQNGAVQISLQKVFGVPSKGQRLAPCLPSALRHSSKRLQSKKKQSQTVKEYPKLSSQNWTQKSHDCYQQSLNASKSLNSIPQSLQRQTLLQCCCFFVFFFFFEHHDDISGEVILFLETCVVFCMNASVRPKLESWILTNVFCITQKCANLGSQFFFPCAKHFFFTWSRFISHKGEQKKQPRKVGENVRNNETKCLFFLLPTGDIETSSFKRSVLLPQNSVHPVLARIALYCAIHICLSPLAQRQSNLVLLQSMGTELNIVRISQGQYTPETNRKSSPIEQTVCHWNVRCDQGPVS